VVVSGGTFKDLFTSPVGFVTSATAPIYGVTSTATTPTKMNLDATRRPGFLTRVGFLASYSSGASTSPILRGAFLQKAILCNDIGAPPDGAEGTALPTDGRAAWWAGLPIERHRMEPWEGDAEVGRQDPLDELRRQRCAAVLHDLREDARALVVRRDRDGPDVELPRRRGAPELLEHRLDALLDLRGAPDAQPRAVPDRRDRRVLDELARDGRDDQFAHRVPDGQGVRHGELVLAAPRSRARELDELIRDFKNDFGATLDERSLVPGEGAQLGATSFEEWLKQSTAAA